MDQDSSHLVPGPVSNSRPHSARAPQGIGLGWWAGAVFLQGNHDRYDGYGNKASEELLNEAGAAMRRTVWTYAAVNGVPGMYPTKEESGIGAEKRTTNFGWDYDTGLRTSVSDQDNGTVQTQDYDVYGRPKDTNSAGMLKVARAYDDASLTASENVDAAVFGDGATQGLTQYDALGRLVWTRSADSTAGQFIFAQTIYLRDNGSGVRELQSAPYRAGGIGAPAGLGWTCVVNDQAGRPIRRARLEGTEAMARGNCEAAVGVGSTTHLVEMSYGAGTRTVGGVARRVEILEHSATPAGFTVLTQLYDAMERLVEVKERINGTDITTASYAYL